jgi:transposase-like protein
MGRNGSYSNNIKMEIVTRYQNGESASKLANEYGIKGKNGDIIIYRWVRRYIALGELIFKNEKSNRSYSKELKEKAIQDYINNEGSYETIANKYGICTGEIVSRWVKRYNRHMEIEDYDPKPEVYMSKSRRTTYKERIEIVEYCISNNKNYKVAAKKYSVNYAQVYTWVKKYIEFGEDKLKDKRGRKKTEEELTEIEKLKLENKKLLARNKYLEMESEVLKKVKEIEREMVREKTKIINTKR